MNQLQALEQQLKDQKELMQRRDDLLQLGQNALFKKMILEDFIVTESARLVAQSADPNLTEKEQKDALSMAQAAGHLKRYINTTLRMGDNAEGDIVRLEEAISEVRQQGDDE